MDPAALRALARWPDVPACYGWLALDTRGRWCLQHEPVRHPGLADYLSRNYSADGRGRYFVQNGPQRVFVRLAYTPVVLFDGPGSGFQCHTGTPFTADAAWLDEAGHVLLSGPSGVGLLEARSLARLTRDVVWPEGSGQPGMLALGDRRLPLRPILRAEVATRFSFDPDPQP